MEKLQGSIDTMVKSIKQLGLLFVRKKLSNWINVNNYDINIVYKELHGPSFYQIMQNSVG